MNDFSDHLRRRPRLRLAAGTSVAAALALTFAGSTTSSKLTVLAGGVAWLVASFFVYRLQADGWVGPKIRFEMYEGDWDEGRERAPIVLFLFGVAAIVVGFTMR